MNSFIAHNDYLLGKGKEMTFEGLMGNLWSAQDIRKSFGMDLSPKPIAEQCLESLLKKEQKTIIEANSKEQHDEPLHDIPALP